MALYFWGGAWGAVLLWAFGVFLLLPFIGSIIALFIHGMEMAAARRWPAAVLSLLGSVMLGAGWLCAAGYVAWRGYLAIP